MAWIYEDQSVAGGRTVLRHGVVVDVVELEGEEAPRIAARVAWLPEVSDPIEVSELRGL